MSENKFTPGPWEVVQNSRRLEIRPVDGSEHRSAIAHIYRSGVYNANKYRMPSYANAALIAAAPETVNVLERAEALLRDLADYVPPGEYRVETINLANECKAVLQKARGEK